MAGAHRRRDGVVLLARFCEKWDRNVENTADHILVSACKMNSVPFVEANRDTGEPDMNVTRPWGDSAWYDFIVEHQGWFLRIQMPVS
jgi:hypothetical protein